MSRSGSLIQGTEIKLLNQEKTESIFKSLYSELLEIGLQDGIKEI